MFSNGVYSKIKQSLPTFKLHHLWKPSWIPISRITQVRINHRISPKTLPSATSSVSPSCTAFIQENPPRRHASITQAFELMTPPPPAKITQALRGRTTQQTVNKTFSLGSPCFGSFPAGTRITTTHCGGVLGRQRHTQQVTRSKLARKQSTQTAASGSGSSRTEKVLSLQRLCPTVAPYTHASTTPHRDS